MPYRICKAFEVESGHQLAKHPDACRFPHGHTRRVEIIVEADSLNARDMVTDFKVVKAAAKEAIDAYDHALCVNTDDPMHATLKQAYGERIISFEKQDPTTEVITKLIFDIVSARLAELTAKPLLDHPPPQGVRVRRVRIYETSSCWAEYEA